MLVSLTKDGLDWPSELPRVEVQCAGIGYFDYLRPEEDEETQEKTVQDDPNAADSSVALDFSRDLNGMGVEQLQQLDHYQVLGNLPYHATAEDVKQAWRKASLIYHPDKKNATTEEKTDHVFLRIKAAFECLSNEQKRKSYDSTELPFDETIPTLEDYQDCDSDTFYRDFGPVFERNLRFDARGRTNSSKQTKHRRRRNAHSHTPLVRLLGNDDTPMEQVHAFYEHWIHFESWRDFSLQAAQQDDQLRNVEDAESRYEKRWLQKEIDKRAKQLKRQEMARIQSLVQTAMALDPRLKRERLQQRQEKERLRQERLQRQEQERLEEERQRQEHERIQQERQEQERQQKQQEKQEREQKKKALRKARQFLRKQTLQRNHQPIWESLEDMHDDVELLCSELTIQQLTQLNDKLTDPPTILTVVHERVQQLRDEQKQAKLDADQRREQQQQEENAKQASSSTTAAWTKEELSALAKGVRKFPPGGANRWGKIASFVNNTCKLSEPRSKEECIDKYKTVAHGKETTKTADSKPNDGDDWTEEQDKQLQAGLAQFPSSMDKNERWSAIAKGVTGKTKKQCVQRFKAIREAIKNKK